MMGKKDLVQIIRDNPGCNAGFGRELLGQCGGIETMEFDITWYGTGRASDA